MSFWTLSALGLTATTSYPRWRSRCQTMLLPWLFGGRETPVTAMRRLARNSSAASLMGFMMRDLLRDAVMEPALHQPLQTGPNVPSSLTPSGSPAPLSDIGGLPAWTVAVDRRRGVPD